MKITLTVQAIALEGDFVLLTFEGGETANISKTRDLNLKVGDVVVFDKESNEVTKATPAVGATPRTKEGS